MPPYCTRVYHPVCMPPYCTGYTTLCIYLPTVHPMVHPVYASLLYTLRYTTVGGSREPFRTVKEAPESLSGPLRLAKRLPRAFRTLITRKEAPESLSDIKDSYVRQRAAQGRPETALFPFHCWRISRSPVFNS